MFSIATFLNSTHVVGSALLCCLYCCHASDTSCEFWFKTLCLDVGSEVEVLPADDWVRRAWGVLPGHLQTLSGHLRHAADQRKQREDERGEFLTDVISLMWKYNDNLCFPPWSYFTSAFFFLFLHYTFNTLLVKSGYILRSFCCRTTVIVYAEKQLCMCVCVCRLWNV